MPYLCNSWLLIVALLVSMPLANNVVASESSLGFSFRLFGEGYKGYDEDEQRSTYGGAWHGKNETSGTGFESTEGQQVAFSGTYQYGDFYTGLSIQFGEKYSFKNSVPDQVTQAGTTELSSDEIDRKELDIIFGYYVHEYFSLFADIKGISNTWQSNHYRQEFLGLGVGATGLWPIVNNLTLYGSTGFVFTGEVKGDGQKVGKGQGVTLDIGLMYAINQNHRLMIGHKDSYFIYKFDAGDEQTHRMSTLYLGYSYAFSLH